ncbi:DUF481 domain-containing protein [Cellvibrio sp. UBA7661]|uniref:DUF481 domain-containing protein n=1 Tax=Cellvibrio sp. UBA7661 TaxID=1946311 RepID=UPI002F350ECD
MSKTLLIVCLLFLSFAPVSHAGVVELLNGDRLEGELVSIDADNLLWRSKNFGDQNIKKTNIKNIQTHVALKINGNNNPCYLEPMDAEYLRYRCGESAPVKRASLLRIKTLIPYDTYVKDSYVHHGRIHLWGAYSRGNEVRNEWNAQGEVNLRRNDFRHVISGEFARASWNYATAQERWNLHYSLDWFMGEHWFWYNSVLIGADPQRGMRSYERLGSGAGYQFYENKTMTLALRSGLALHDESYQLLEGVTGDYVLEDDFVALGVALDFSYNLPWGVGIFHNNEVLQSTEDDPNLQLKTSTGLSTMILKRIYSEFKIDYWLDKDPQPARQPKDTRMSLGVSYKW